MNTYTVVTDIRQDMLKTRKDTDNQSWVVGYTRTLQLIE